MTISSSLSASVSGLAVNATRLATISNNIANSDTDGYKSSEIEFSSLVLNGRSSNYVAGGVKSHTYKNVEEEGGIRATGNPTDIALQGGAGLLPVTDATNAYGGDSVSTLRLTATGSFEADSNGFLRTRSGHFLLGWPADPTGTITPGSRDSVSGLEAVNIDIGELDASPTTLVNLGINLNSDETVAGATGTPQVSKTSYFDNFGKSQELTLTFTPTIPATGQSNIWTVSIADAAGGPTTSLTVEFDSSSSNAGRVLSVTPTAPATYDPATGNITTSTASGPIDFFIGVPGGNRGLTQLASNFAPHTITRDGNAVGEFNNVEVNDQGIIEAVYDNGVRRPIYQIPVAIVPNFNGLTAEDAQAFSISSESGEFYLWDSGRGPAATVTGFAISESTAEIASALTDLIRAQRAYSSNAKVVQTVDEMLQETTNIKR